MSRARLCELLSSVSTHHITTGSYVIGKPIASGDSGQTSITIKPRSSQRQIGSQNVTYTRLSLDKLPISSLVWRGEESLSELLSRDDIPICYNYRILDPNVPGKVMSRALRIKPEDIIDSPIFVSGSSVEITLYANPDSDFFFGSTVLTLRLSN